MDKLKSLFKSRRFIKMAAGVVVVIFGHYGLDINSQQEIEIVALLSAWIIGDSVRETK